MTMNLYKLLYVKTLMTGSRKPLCCCCTCFDKHYFSVVRGKHTKSKKYSDSVRLPKTDFPLSLRGNASSSREVEIQRVSGFDSLYSWQYSQDRNKEFVLHDGPPYANGKPHVGHALNKILKDITNRSKLLQGYRVHYIPGWDCHGLPIELKALTSDHDRQLEPLAIRAKSREFAKKTIGIQKAAFRRWGVMADWDQSYLTMDVSYQTDQLDVFYHMYKQGLVYRDEMPVYWSPSARTALAESELEYREDHVSTSVYVRFPLTNIPAVVRSISGADAAVYIVMWTTTPWTLPANRAVCYGPSLRYKLVKGGKSQNLYICGEQFVDRLQGLTDEKLTELANFSGSDLEGAHYNMPFIDQTLPLVSADFVTADKGTGLVHSAPAHGHDDFKLAQKQGLRIVSVVNDEGLYSEEAGPSLAGLNILTEATPQVVQELGECLLGVEEYTHSYPYDWRTKQPVIIRTSKQWFVSTQSLRERALERLKDVSIHPHMSERGMLSQIASRTYWCISRQRAWGVPIPVFYTKTDNVILTDQTMEHVQSLFRRHGSDCWWSLPMEELLPASLAQQAGVISPSDCVRGRDILDIWFDSGSSWNSVLKDVGGQADVYCEGMDQFGGWFLSSLLTSVAVQGKPPYRALLVHGFTLDEDGKKMSKSLGNVMDPDVVVSGGKNLSQEPAYGADVLRWWAASSHRQTNVFIGPKLLQQFHETVFKIRKCLRFLLGNLGDFSPKTDVLPVTDLLPQDRYMLHLLFSFHHQCVAGYEELNYSKVVQAVEKFVNAQVSNFYCHVIKDRCYCGSEDPAHLLSTLTVQYHILQTVTKAMAPILPHLAEELYQYFPGVNGAVSGKKLTVPQTGEIKSIFREVWEMPDASWEDAKLQREIEAVLSIQNNILGVMGTDTSTEFDVVLHSSGELLNLFKMLQATQTSSTSPLCELLRTSRTSVIVQPPRALTDDSEVLEGYCQLNENSEAVHYTAIVLPAKKDLCERCRRYTANHKEELCPRCVAMVRLAGL